MRGAFSVLAAGRIVPSFSQRSTRTRLARKWTANIVSKPCGVRRARRGTTPALRTAMSIFVSRSLNSSQSWWTERMSERSTRSISIRSEPEAARTSSPASGWPLRQAIRTWPPRLARSMATALPSPLLDPVTRHVLPSIRIPVALGAAGEPVRVPFVGSTDGTGSGRGSISAGSAARSRTALRSTLKSLVTRISFVGRRCGGGQRSLGSPAYSQGIPCLCRYEAMRFSMASRVRPKLPAS